MLMIFSPGASTDFNPRSPYGERPIMPVRSWRSSTFQSTLPLRGATQDVGSQEFPIWISIHAPLTGSDGLHLGGIRVLSHFNPRSPYGERPPASLILHQARRFQSTLPLRGATTFDLASTPSAGFQSTLPLRGATSIRALTFSSRAISIHAPLTGSDRYSPSQWRPFKGFQSTLPLRGATICLGGRNPGIPISIHAPLTGSDAALRSQYVECLEFQSTLPLRGATLHGHGPKDKALISIHAPLTGSDI